MKILAIDIGTGTQDILLFDTRLDVENSYKLILPSPTLQAQKKIQSATHLKQPILIDGNLMGSGPSGWGIENHLKAGLEVFAIPKAAKTLNDDLDIVQNLGIKLISEDEAIRLPAKVIRINFSDLEISSIQQALSFFGVSLDDISVLTVGVFDHGNAPKRISDRKYRFDYLAKRIKINDHLSTFAYKVENIPGEMTRLHAVADAVKNFQFPIMVMDTAPAAVLGATFDRSVDQSSDRIVVNVGNFHTIAFRLSSVHIQGVFEHHTGFLNTNKLDNLLVEFAHGILTNKQIYDDQGHGALILTNEPKRIDMNNPTIIVTGPRWGLLHQSLLHPHFAVPYGDMMTSGCIGLISAATDIFPQYSDEITLALDRDSSAVSPWELDS